MHVDRMGASHLVATSECYRRHLNAGTLSTLCRPFRPPSMSWDKVRPMGRQLSCGRLVFSELLLRRAVVVVAAGPEFEMAYSQGLNRCDHTARLPLLLSGTRSRQPAPRTISCSAVSGNIATAASSANMYACMAAACMAHGSRWRGRPGARAPARTMCILRQTQHTMRCRCRSRSIRSLARSRWSEGAAAANRRELKTVEDYRVFRNDCWVALVNARTSSRTEMCGIFSSSRLKRHTRD
jgi:hypothetical protein